jgi:hypothetical protein
MNIIAHLAEDVAAGFIAAIIILTFQAIVGRFSKKRGRR